MKVKKGFTLSEVLIVVSIIVFLLIMILVLFRKQIFKGQDARRKGDMQRIRVAVEEYEKDHDCYPPKVIVENCNPGTGLQPYLDKIPCDPVTKGPYVAEMDEAICPSWYRIYTKLGNDLDIDIDKVGCEYGCGPDLAYNYYLSSPNAPDPIKGIAPGETSQPTEPGDANFYGCFSGVCTRILWDPQRPGPECDPNWQRGTCSGEECCYYQCGTPQRPRKECLNWQQ